ncbi:MAG: hypothetical protein ACRC5A_02700 [Enterobacteriaceae bacterium]
MAGVTQRGGLSTVQQIQRLSHGLQQAVAARDWLRVQQVDKAIVRLVTLIKSRTVSQQEQQAMDQLKQQYQRNYQFCLQYRCQLQQKMAEYRRNGEGLHAYALFALDELES